MRDHNERLPSGGQRTKACGPFQCYENGLSVGENAEMSQLDNSGHGQSAHVGKVSWLMVGAIGFEPMTSTV